MAAVVVAVLMPTLMLMLKGKVVAVAVMVTTLPVTRVIFVNNLFTKSTDKTQCSYEAPREETREAHGCLAVGWKKITWLRYQSMFSR